MPHHSDQRTAARHVGILALSLWLAVGSEPVCTIGSGATAWSGSPADLAMIEAVHQREQAEHAGRAFPAGDGPPSPWSALVVCRPAPS